MRVLVFSLLLFALGLGPDGLRAQSWNGTAIVVSEGETLVGRRESVRDGEVRYVQRATFFVDTLDNGQLFPYAYRSVHLELAADRAIGSKVVVDVSKAGTEVYELIFYEGRITNPGYKKELATVYLPLRAVKEITNGEQERTHYYSIDMANVPFMLLNDLRLARLDIHRIRYVAD